MVPQLSEEKANEKASLILLRYFNRLFAGSATTPDRKPTIHNRVLLVDPRTITVVADLAG